MPTAPCPNCAAAVDFPADASGLWACPACGATMRIKGRAGPLAAIPFARRRRRRDHKKEENDFDEEPPRPARRGAKPPVVIEQTSKGWKLMQLIGGLGLLTGITMVCAGVFAESAVRAYGFAVVVVALAIYLWGRLGAWWHHG